jgi:mannan endo-1,4-beta-mannosidase
VSRWVPWLLVVAITALVAAQLGLDDGESRRAPVRVTPHPKAELMLGLTTVALARNSFSPWRENGLYSVEEFERDTHAHASVVMWYADWANVRRPDVKQLRAIARRGSLPEITWEPWNHAWDNARQPTYRLRRIIDGRHDGLIRRWARDLAAYGGPVRLRFAHEMNGNWYPWSEAANRNHPGEFAKAWRHVRRIFEHERAANVEWVWSPVALRVKKIEYPGDAYVDRLGLSGFVGGVQLRHRRWRPFEKVFGHSLRQLRRIAPDKPIEISEVGAAEEGGDKPAWIRGMFRALARRPKIDTLIWFNIDKGSDWRIQSSKASVRAFEEGAREPRVGQRAARFALRTHQPRRAPRHRRDG